MIQKNLNFKSLVLDGVMFGAIMLGILYVMKTPSEEELLLFSRNMTAIFACIGIGAVLTVLLNWTGLKTLGQIVFDNLASKTSAVKPWYKTFWGLQFFIVFCAFLYTGLQVTQFSFTELFSEEGFAGAKRIFSSLTSPNLEILPQGFVAIVETIFIAFTATVIAIPVAFVMSFFAAKNIMGKTAIGFAFYTALRTLLNVTRSIEPLIWAIIFSVWVGIGPFSGMLALMLHSVASLTKQYSEIIECVSEGPVEGIQATGASFIQVIWFAVVPQIVLPIVSFTIYRWDINVRMATIIGLVGGGGIGTMLMQYQGQALWHEVGTLVLLIAVVVWLMDTASAYVREALK